MDKNFKLVDASEVENKEFADAFKELLNKFPHLSVKCNIVKNCLVIKMDDGKMQEIFVDSPTLLIQKKIEEVTAEVVKEEGIPSTNPEVNPQIKDEPNQTA